MSFKNETSEPLKPLKEAIKNGTLGELKVDKNSLRIKGAEVGKVFYVVKLYNNSDTLVKPSLVHFQVMLCLTHTKYLNRGYVLNVLSCYECLSHVHVASTYPILT